MPMFVACTVPRPCNLPHLLFVGGCTAPDISVTDFSTLWICDVPKANRPRLVQHPFLFFQEGLLSSEWTTCTHNLLGGKPSSWCWSGTRFQWLPWHCCLHVLILWARWWSVVDECDGLRWYYILLHLIPSDGIDIYSMSVLWCAYKWNIPLVRFILQHTHNGYNLLMVWVVLKHTRSNPLKL